MEPHSFDEDLDTVVDRLISDRPRLGPVDLDRIKLQALGRGVSHGFVPGPVRRRVLAPIVTMGLMGGGTAGVLAATGDVTTAAKPSDKPQCVQYDSHGQPKMSHGVVKMKTCKPPKPPTSKPPTP